MGSKCHRRFVSDMRGARARQHVAVDAGWTPRSLAMQLMQRELSWAVNQSLERLGSTPNQRLRLGISWRKAGRREVSVLVILLISLFLALWRLEPQATRSEQG